MQPFAQPLPQKLVWDLMTLPNFTHPAGKRLFAFRFGLESIRRSENRLYLFECLLRELRYGHAGVLPFIR